MLQRDLRRSQASLRACVTPGVDAGSTKVSAEQSAHDRCDRVKSQDARASAESDSCSNMRSAARHGRRCTLFIRRTSFPVRFALRVAGGWRLDSLGHDVGPRSQTSRRHARKVWCSSSIWSPCRRGARGARCSMRCGATCLRAPHAPRPRGAECHEVLVRAGFGGSTLARMAGLARLAGPWPRGCRRRRVRNSAMECPAAHRGTAAASG